MSQIVNQKTLDEVLATITFRDRSRKADYNDLFYKHLYDVNQFQYISGQDKGEAFGIREYVGLEQYIIENTDVIEEEKPETIEWDVLDNARDMLSEKIKKSLIHEKNSDFLKPIVNFTVDAFENYLQYFMMHPNSLNNPWIPTRSILGRGYTYLISGNEELVNEYSPKIYKNVGSEESNNTLGFITKARKEKNFKGIIVDNRIKLQHITLEYLKDFANGFDSAMTKAKILDHINSSGISSISINKFNKTVLLPLKRAGIVGSSSTGFYYMSSFSDIQKSYEFHYSKFAGIKKVLDIYKKRATEFGETLRY